MIEVAGGFAALASDAEQKDIRSRILTLEKKITGTNAKSRIPEIAATLVAPLQHELQELKNRLNAGRPESALASFAHSQGGANTGQSKVDPTGVAPPTVAWDIFGKLETSADQAKAKLQEVSNVTVFSKIETSGINAANAKLDALKDKLWSVSSGMKNLGSVGTGVVGRSMRGANAH